MKKLLSIVYTIIQINIILGQCDESKILSTNPSASINTDLNTRLKAYTVTGVPVNEFKNQFNWGANNSNGFLNIQLNPDINWGLGRTHYTMFSPFEHTVSGNYPYLWISSTTPKENLPWQWSEGWELMLLNTGYFPNGDKYDVSDPARILDGGNNQLSNSRIPFFVLYNRYNGKMRLFFNTRQDLDVSPANHILTKLKFGTVQDGFINGTLRNLANFDRPLDQKTDVTYISTNNPSPYSTQVWASSDFQLGYDPCVCEQNSTLNFDFELINEWTVNLSGRSIETTKELSNLDEDFLTNNFMKNSDAGAPNGKWGNFMYKEINSMYDNYKNELENYNQKLAEYNKTENYLVRELMGLSKELLVNGTIGALVPSEGTKKLVETYMKTIDGNFDVNKAGDMSKGIIKTATSLLGSGHDYLTQQLVGSEIMNKPVKPTMPTVAISEMQINGIIKTSTTLSTNNFYTPGSFNASSTQSIAAHSYPIYNKPTGLFALLKTPSLQFYEALVPNSMSMEINTLNFDWSNWSDWNYTPGTFLRKRQRSAIYKSIMKYKYNQDIYFRLKENLLYKLNHHLDIDFNNSDVRVQILVEMEPENVNDDFYLEEESRNFANNNFNKTVNQIIDLESTNLTVLEHKQRIDGKNENVILASQWIPIRDVGYELFGGRLKNMAYFDVAQGTITNSEWENLLVVSPSWVWGNTISTTEDRRDIQKNRDKYLIQYSAYENDDVYVVKPEVANNLKFKVKSVKLKIMPSLTFLQTNSAGDKNMTTQVFTYLLKNDEIDLIQDKGEYLNATTVQTIKKYNPGKVKLTDEVIEPTDPFVSEVIGNEIIVNANNFELAGTISTASGYSAKLQYRENVEFIGNFTIDPNITIEEKLDFDFFGSGITSEATDVQLENFCIGTNKKYLADQLTEPARNNADTVQSKISIKEISVTLAPNPTDLSADLLIFSNEEGVFNCQLMDVTGKIIQQQSIELINTKASSKINTANLSEGLYFIVVSNKNTKVTKRLMVQH